MIQSLLNGAIEGLLLAVVGVAFSLVYATTRVFHLALGAIYALAPYILLSANRAGWPAPLGVGFAVLAAVAIGLIADQFMHWPLERRRASTEVQFISSLGAFLAIGQVIVLIWGNDAQLLQTGIDAVYQIAGLRITGGQALGAVVAATTLAGMFAFLHWTAVGLEFRGMASNPSLLATLGRKVRTLRSAVFGLSSALATVAALAAARDVGFDPNVGMNTVLVGIVAAIVGGRGSFAGAAVAGFILGVLRAQIGWSISTRWEDATTFLVLAAFLLVVPGGLKSLVAGRAIRIEDT